MPKRIPTAQGRSTAVTEALNASHRAERDRVLALLDGIRLRVGPEAPLRERFLAAELAYLRGRFPEAIKGFEDFEKDPRSASAPPWQRFLSSHRRTFSYLHLGYGGQAEAVFREAKDRLEELPVEERRWGELDAMRGHLLVQQGEYERARAWFFASYERSIETTNWRRASTAAADVASMHLRMGQLPEAHQWLDRAEEARARSGHLAPSDTIRARRGHIFRVEGKLEKALACYIAVIEAGDGDGPDALESALLGRAEVSVAENSYTAAEADLQQAIGLCLQIDNRDHAAYAYRDLANLYLAWARDGDERRAVEAFAQAMRLALTLEPPQPGTIMDLAEEVLRRPALIGGRLPAVTATSLRDQTAELRSLTRPHPHAQAARAREAKLASERLLAVFKSVADGQVKLKHRVVSMLSGRMTPPPTPGRLKLTPGELEVLRILLLHPDGVEIETVSDVLDISLEAASRRVMRLQQLLTPDLRPRRKANDRLYFLNIAPTEEPQSPAGD